MSSISSHTSTLFLTPSLTRSLSLPFLFTVPMPIRFQVFSDYHYTVREKKVQITNLVSSYTCSVQIDCAMCESANAGLPISKIKVESTNCWFEPSKLIDVFNRQSLAHESAKSQFNPQNVGSRIGKIKIESTKFWFTNRQN